jgi:RhtB (resistance to homoserine/threonine) family protein
MLLTLLSAYAVFLVAVLSPGPDFAVTVRNSVRFGRRAGVLTAFGIACGNLVHIAYVGVGLGALIAHSVVAFSVMKFIAAAYLAWIGSRALCSKPYKADIAPPDTAPDTHSFRRGFVTSALNPKAALFWLSYFTVVLEPRMPAAVLSGFVALLVVSVAAWFSLVSCVMSRPAVREKFLRMGHWFDRATGAVLIALGVKVALTQR